MKILTGVPAERLNDVPNLAHVAENNGFSGLSTQENRHNPFLPLAIAAVHSQHLELRTNVAIAFARSPMVAAGLAWDLQYASAGRFVLGLGSQVKGHNQRRFSVAWSPPAPRLREYIDAIRAIWVCWRDGTPLKYEGQHYQFSLMTPNFTPEPLTSALPKLQIAAVGPAMMRVAAAACDGVMLHAFCTPKYLKEDVLPGLIQGLTARGGAREQFEISGGGFVVTGADQAAIDKQFEWVRARIGFYGSTPSYWPVLASHGLQDLGEELNALSKAGRWDDMTRRIPDELVHEFAAVAPYDQIKSRIESHFGGLVDCLSLPPDTPPDLVEDLKTIPCLYQSDPV
ncbi:MAG: putative F420-dependent oxidoreductase [Candidatus Azotimanducaceae bacterium]|jgi:probable F420-dependent oxidoreductase|tara:strand:- start:12961 stop:13983 length:1023 start_codon:yes stop_codon:yes gene_type:complete